MTSIKSRAVTGTRSSSRAARSAASGLIRAGLLGSTALVAVGLAATGAMAQTYNPTGGGTIVITGGGTTTDNTATGGGFQNVGSTGRTVTDVNITNTTGAPSSSAINFSRSTFSGSGDGLQLSGTNTLVAAAGGNAITLSSTGGNNTGIGFNGTLNATGLNGVAVSTLGELYQSGAATLNLTAQTPGSGSGLLWSARAIGDVSLSGPFSASNFQYGANLTASNSYLYFTTGTGGAITGATTGVGAQANTDAILNIGSSIAATTTGISANSTTGAVSVTATGAITAATGITATAVTGSTVTTSGGGTLNSTGSGVGTGIVSTSTGGTGASAITVGAAIGGSVRFGTGIQAQGGVGAGVGDDTIRVSADVRGTSTGIRTNSAFTTTVDAGATVAGTSYGINMVTGGGVVNNSGTISGNAAIFNNNNVPFTLDNAVGGSVTGIDYGVYTSGLSTTQISNSGSISASSSYGLLMSNGGTLVNTATGVITGGSNVNSGYAIAINNGTESITNNGTVTGGAVGAIIMAGFGSQSLTLGAGSVTTGAVNVQYGSLTATIAGTLNGTLTSDGAGSNFGSGNITVAATGAISGGTDGIVSSRGLTLVSSGAISGATNAINHTSSVSANVSLRAGSTTTGAVLLAGGNDTVQLYSGQGTANGGTLAAASFGAIDMGTGTNTLVLRGIGDGTAANGAAGTMANGTVGGVSNLSKIDSGLWTLTGAGNYAGTTTVSGGTLRVLNTGNGLGNGAVSIATGATLNFDNQTGGLMSVKGDSFTGAGRILFSGNTGSVTALGNGGNGNVQISLSQGGLIDVQSGTVNGSSSGQGFWTSNMGSLNIASGARLDAVEGLVRVDALTGAGTLSGGFGGTVPVTVGVAGGSGTFSGVIRDSTEFAGRYLALTKIGAGTQTLSGTNTYTGQTSIEGGTLEVRNGSAIADTGVVSVSSGATFLVANAETIGRLTGAGAVNLAGGSLTLSNSSGSYSGAMSGVGSLVLSGGTLSLGGALTNSGGLVLSGTTGASLLSTGSINLAGNAVTMNGTANTFTNSGSVSSSGGTGVFSSGALTLINNTGGAISGRGAVYAAGVGTVTNAAGASITAGSLNNTVRLAGNGSTLTNAGTISGTTNFSGVFFDGTGTVTNQAGGSISNTSTAVQFAGNGSSLVNAGTITSATSNFTSVYFDGTGSVTNQAGGVISNIGQVVNFVGAGSSLDNAGTISNTGASSAVYLGSSGSVVNRSGASISSGSGRGVRIAGTGVSVDNAGLISGGLAGVLLEGLNGSIVNTGTLRVTGSTDFAAVYGTAAGASVTNAGLIDSSVDGGHGVSLIGGTGSITNQSGGTISGNGSGAAIVLGGAGYTLDLQAGSTVNGLIDASATTGLNTVSLAGTLTGGYAGGSGADNVTLIGGMTVSGVIDGGSGSDALVLGGLADASLDIGQTTGFESRAMAGDGTWTLSGTDSSTADWTLDSGTLRVSGGQSVNDGAGVLVNSGATLSVGNSEAINALNGAGAVVIDASQMLYVGANGADSGFSGIISGPGGLSQSGAGTLTLYGANTYSGDTRVDAGTLRLGTSGVIADTSRLIVQTGATLDMQGNDETVALAYLNGTVNNSVPPPSPLAGGAGDGPQATPSPTGTGTLTAAEYQLNGATINANLGSGNLFNTGGVSILNGTSAAGQVGILAGTLRLGQSERLADTATLSVSSGATLDLQGHDETVAVALLNGTLNSTVSAPDNAQVIPALSFSSKGTDGPLTVPLPTGTGTLTAAQYQLNGATITANLGTGSLFNVGGVSILNGTAAASSVSVQSGTLSLGAANRLADAATVSVSSGAILNLNAFNDTVGLALLNGTLAGTGTLTATQYQLNGATITANLGTGSLFNVGGVSTLTGTAAASQINVNAGTLRLGASDRLADTAGVSVSSGATFDVSSRTDTIGALNGAGNVTTSTGRLTFGGATSTFGGTLSGGGSLVHTSGLFALSGNHTLQTISNTGGELRFVGSTTGGVAVSGGSLTGAGTIGGALTVSNGATLSPGLAGQLNGIGTFTTGSLSLNGGTLALDVLGRAGGNLSDRLVVSGTANLTGGVLTPVFQSPVGGYDFLTRYQFLTAGQLVGTFSNGAAFSAATARPDLFWRVRYDLAPNTAVLELRSLVNFDLGTSGTGNQNAVGQALTGGQLQASDDWAGVVTLLSGLTGPQRQAAFDSLGGEALADVSSSLLAANDAFNQAVRQAGSSRIPGATPLNFASAFSFVGGRDGASAMVTSVLGAFDPSAGTGSADGGWISVHASDVDLEGKAGQADLQTRLNAFVGGYAVGAGDYVVGAAAGATRVEGDVIGRRSSYESDLLHAAAYARFDDGRWAADLTASVYGGEIDTRRTITVGAYAGQAIGQTHGEGQSLSASVARRFDDDSGGAISVGMMQTLSRSTLDAFTETGAGGLSLDVADQERNWQTTQVNLRGTQDYQLSGQPLRLYGGLGLLVTTGDREAAADLRFSGAPTGFGSFGIEGAQAAPLAGTAEFGLEYQPREGLTLSTGYRTVFSDRLQDNQIGARMSVAW